MRTLIMAMTCAGVLALGGVTQAAQIATPTIFGSGEQDAAECAVFNGGTTALAVTVKILNEVGGREATYSCGGPVAPGQFCAVFRPIDNEGAFACVATAGSTASLRGALVLYEKVLDSFGLFRFRAIRSSTLQ
jgi:hypothetical protein